MPKRNLSVEVSQDPNPDTPVVYVRVAEMSNENFAVTLAFNDVKDFKDFVKTLEKSLEEGLKTRCGF